MSPQRRRVPPGRAGRLKLRHSLDSAQRGADLLERKLRLLLDKERTLRREADEAGRLWQTRLAEAETWLVRGVLIGGEQALAQAVPADLARVEIEWTSLMGVTYPSAVSWRAPARSPVDRTPGNTALAHAEDAYRAAVRAAAEHCTARTAADLIAAEAETTRQRVRALRRHWIPRLTHELSIIELALEEAEHEEAVRRRWAASPHRRSPR